MSVKLSNGVGKATPLGTDGAREYCPETMLPWPAKTLTARTGGAVQALTGLNSINCVSATRFETAIPVGRQYSSPRNLQPASPATILGAMLTVNNPTPVPPPT